MAESFDAYYEWLGIAPKDQPPNHYRLLGIDLYEASPKVIESAADRQMAHLRTFQTGPRVRYCEELLNKVSAARVTFLDPDKKAAYDLQLKEKPDGKSATSKRRVARALPLGEPVATATPLEASAPAVGMPIESQAPTPRVHSHSHRHRGRRQKSPPWVALGIGGALLVVVAVVTMMAMSGGDEQQVARKPTTRTPKKTAAQQAQSPNPPAVVSDEPAEIDPSAGQTSVVAPENQDAPSAKLPTYLRPNKFDDTPTVVVKREETPVERPAKSNPFEEALPDEDPPPEGDPLPEVVSPQTLAAVPIDEALKKADAEIRTVFDFKAATDLKSRKKLAAEIISTAMETDNESAAQYAMLRMARDIAIHLGDFASAEKTITEMSERFDIDALDMRSKMTIRAMTSRLPAEKRAKVALAGLALAGEFHQADRHKEALSIITAVGRAAARIRNKKLVASARQMALDNRMLAKQYRAVRRAFETLKTDPDDPAANSSAGEYLCLVKGDWDRGLAMLAKGDDAQLKDLAAREQRDSSKPQEQLALGDAWWKVSQQEKGAAKLKAQIRAAEWYRKAVSEFDGLIKVRAEKRIAQADADSEQAEKAKEPPVRTLDIVYLPTRPNWQRTGFGVQAGQTIRVQAAGEVTYMKSHLRDNPYVSADGFKGLTNFKGFSVRGGSLLLKIGPNIYQGGTDVTLTAKTTGEIELGIPEKGRFSNNAGRFLVRLTVQ